MRLEHLCDVEMRCDLLAQVEDSAAGEGRIYGQGTALVSGRASGTARWSNVPRVHGEYARPDARERTLSMRYYSCHVEWRPEGQEVPA